MHLDAARQLVERALDQESDALDNLPDSFFASESYEKMEAAVDLLEDASLNIEDAIEKIGAAAG